MGLNSAFKGLNPAETKDQGVNCTAVSQKRVQWPAPVATALSSWSAYRPLASQE